MIIVRLAASLVLLSLGFWITNINISPLLLESNIVTTSGIINIWAGIASFFWGGYGLIYYIFIFHRYNNKSLILDFNKMTIVIGIIISPLLSIFIFYTTNVKVQNYVECTDLREISTRYSSRTYAKSIDLCKQEK
ncbi:hypothetical protein [Vibrio paucivorans]|uniref:DUF1240 domain-containing protein n=1 Tax=Vibrio paucivorans TaxID=2829489 RepID=A0A9X3CGZ6_9VIBR|nr:hypothetical protein [Vibrio paucivorans]MCW8335632.1 hypothetical protein [Vibrio paucivorans]